MSEKQVRSDRLWDRLRDRWTQRWSRNSREAIEAADEARTQQSRGTMPIVDIRERERVTVSGVVQSMTFAPVDAPARLVATLYDGTGSVELLWNGRRTIPGVDVGRHLEVEGTVNSSRDHLSLIDPVYRILGTSA